LAVDERENDFFGTLQLGAWYKSVV